ncbi:UNVERIFIED_CONTAM: hypothetical protein FKN15_077459 [Acipenser sinensis]
MPHGNDSCFRGQESVNYFSYMIHLWEEWTGLGNMEDYFSYLDYLVWVFTPLAVVFILPLFIVVFIYLSILFLHVYKRKNELKEAYSYNLWDGARKTLATLWDRHATIWHGYEIHGLEKIPDKGPALIVNYHGAIPTDYYYFLANVIIQKGRTCHSVADHFLFKLPGFKLLLEVFSVIHGPQQECVRALKNGHLLAISPGGAREAIFSDETYTLMWGNRKGFAQVAIDAKVPIIPIFTQNVREGFRSLGSIKLYRWVYEKFRLPIAPIYGGFPVKFRTYLGDPIAHDPNLTAAELADKSCGRDISVSMTYLLPSISGFKLLLEVFSVIHGPQQECVRALKNGHLLAISPGGAREAIFSDETYTLMWGNRKGFAQVAIDAKVPIIPIFTQNVREGLQSLGSIKLYRWVYEKFRLPIAPIYGGFPVKFRTYLGDPIAHDPNLTAAELADKVKLAVQSLIDRHQMIPGNIFRALLERFHRRHKED